uniref:Uncharacterized protein n=1 Tax=Cryptosporidium parvum TaxID=5807 RepID=F0X5L2_CRYPV
MDLRKIDKKISNTIAYSIDTPSFNHLFIILFCKMKILHNSYSELSHKC